MLARSLCMALLDVRLWRTNQELGQPCGIPNSPSSVLRYCIINWGSRKIVDFRSSLPDSSTERLLWLNLS